MCEERASPISVFSTEDFSIPRCVATKASTRGQVGPLLREVLAARRCVMAEKHAHPYKGLRQVAPLSSLLLTATKVVSLLFFIHDHSMVCPFSMDTMCILVATHTGIHNHNWHPLIPLRKQAADRVETHVIIWLQCARELGMNFALITYNTWSALALTF